jgi:hypothetical protein
MRLVRAGVLTGSARRSKDSKRVIGTPEELEAAARRCRAVSRRERRASCSI